MPKTVEKPLSIDEAIAIARAPFTIRILGSSYPSAGIAVRDERTRDRWYGTHGNRMRSMHGSDSVPDTDYYRD